MRRHDGQGHERYSPGTMSFWPIYYVELDAGSLGRRSAHYGHRHGEENGEDRLAVLPSTPSHPHVFFISTDGTLRFLPIHSFDVAGWTIIRIFVSHGQLISASDCYFCSACNGTQRWLHSQTNGYRCRPTAHCLSFIIKSR